MGVFSWLTDPLEPNCFDPDFGSRVEHDLTKMTVKIGRGPSQIEITERLKADMGKHKFEQLAELMRHINALVDPQKILDEVLLASPATQTSQRNYEAAINSRLSVLTSPPVFDMLKVYRTRDGEKFYVFVVYKDKWSVLEDNALFPSDTLISALRLLDL